MDGKLKYQLVYPYTVLSNIMCTHASGDQKLWYTLPAGVPEAYTISCVGISQRLADLKGHLYCKNWPLSPETSIVKM